MEITREKLMEVCFDRMAHHSDMMAMFRKSHSTQSWGFRGHKRGYERAEELLKSLQNGKEISTRVVAAYMGKGSRLVD